MFNKKKSIKVEKKNDGDLTKGSIPKLIRKIAIPASIGFFFNTMYNVVDTFYAGLLSTEALSAMSISFPVFFIILAFGSGISTGASALISNSLGEKNEKKARLYTAQSTSFGLILSVILTIIGLYVAPTLFRILGAEGSYLDLSLSYINVIFFGTVSIVMVHVLNSALISIGDTKTLRNILIIGFFMNLVLDPWFMFGGFGLPAMGLAGIALATVIIIACQVFIILYKVIKSGLLNKDSWRLLMPQKKTYIDISKQGVPASLNMMTVAIGIFVITFFLSKFGKEAVAAYGISTRIEQIALLPIIGLNMATLSLVGQNNGAKLFDRVKETIRRAQKYGLIIVTFGAFLMAVFATQLMKIFTDDAAVIEIGIVALYVAALTTWSYLILFLNTSALQGLKKPMYAIYIGLFRQIVAPLIVFSLLTPFMGIYGIWWGVFGINWIAAIITLIYVRYVLKKKCC